jgi:hypothetical protein
MKPTAWSEGSSLVEPHDCPLLGQSFAPMCCLLRRSCRRNGFPCRLRCRELQKRGISQVTYRGRAEPCPSQPARRRDGHQIRCPLSLVIAAIRWARHGQMVCADRRFIGPDFGQPTTNDKSPGPKVPGASRVTNVDQELTERGGIQGTPSHSDFRMSFPSAHKALIVQRFT